MPKVTGTLGSVTFATGYVLHTKSFELKINGETVDSTDFVDGAAGWMSNLPSGVKSWSGSWVSMIDSATAVILPGAAAASAVFTATTSRTFTGAIIVNSVDVGVAVGALSECTFNFVGSGALTPA